MPKHAADILINAGPGEIFDLIHDYGRRLAWDPFLRKAELFGTDAAAAGVEGRCVARFRSGGLGLSFVYISFDRPHVAAIRMTAGPWLLREFFASLRQVPIAAGQSRVIYTVSFKARPTWARAVLEPIFSRVFMRETRQRLKALKRYMEEGRPELAPAPQRP